MRIIFTILLFFVSIVILQSDRSEPYDERDTIVVGFTNNPPFAYQEDMNRKGIRLEIAREITERAGYTFVPRFLPWNRAVLYIKQGKIDAISGIWYREERESFLYYPREPFTFERTAIYQRRDLDNFTFMGLEDFRDLTVGIIRGYAYPDDFLNADYFRREEVASNEQNILKLSAGRLDVSLIESDVGDYLILHHGKQNTIKKNANYFDDGIWNYLAFSRQSPHGRVLSVKYDRIINEMIDDGTYQAIYEKYLKRGPEKLPTPPNRVSDLSASSG